MQPLLDKLNPEQRRAVETVDGPLLILAGAGSGKTRVITYRIAHLVENVGVAPDSILAVTFTNKAASEMAERVEQLVGHRTFAKPLISTFHSLCVRILRRDIEALLVDGKGLRKDFVIYDEKDQEMVAKTAVRRLGLDDKKLTPRTILSHISWAKNHMLDPQDYYLSSADPKTEKIAQVYKIYRQELARANALDFDDLLLEAQRLLKSVPEVRAKYQRRWHYLLVDEYQDTNRPQYEIMRLLAGERHNVCAVGDEDQSIYSWRGADIRNILEFEQDFPEAKIIRLEQNYRSTENILQAASAVVANNLKRKGKRLWTARQGGARIGYYEAPDGENEALFAADYISRYVRKCGEDGTSARAAVLYRTNSQSRLFEEALRRYNLSYHVVGGFSFYERAEIKDMISYLKLILNPADSVALLRIINTPTRGIGKTTMETVERIALETGIPLWDAVAEAIRRKLLPQRATAALKTFRDIIEDARAMLSGTYTERLSDSVRGEAEVTAALAPAAIQVPEPKPEAGDQHGLEFVDDAIDFSPENFDADLRDGPEPSEAITANTSRAPEISESVGATPPEIPPAETAENGKRVFRIATQHYRDLQNTLKRLDKAAAKRRIPTPTIHIHEEGPLGPDGEPLYYRLSASGELPRISGWKFRGAIRHREGINELHPLPGQSFPEGYEYASAVCYHCNKDIERKFTFIVENKNGDIKQLGSTCVDEYLPDAKAHVWFAEKLFLLQDKLEHYSKAIQSETKQARRPPEQYEYSYPVSSPRELLRRPEPSAPRAPEQLGKSGYDVGFDPEALDDGLSFDATSYNAAAGATTAELLKFLLDRTGYMRQLEQEETPEAEQRMENLRELINAALDSRDRGESVGEFLDHAALVSDADQYDAAQQITLMTLHAAKGLEFSLVFLVGLEEGLFPHSRTLLAAEDIEEERRLCYVGMTRAMDTLVLSRARFRRRYATESAEPTTPSRFLDETPAELLEDLGSPGRSPHPARNGFAGNSGRGQTTKFGGGDDSGGPHYDYENEDQSAAWNSGSRGGDGGAKTSYPGRTYNSIENIAEFFASRGKRFSLPKTAVPEPTGKRGFRKGDRVRHPKYGEGIIYLREGEGEDAKITVQFSRFGLKKLVEKYAQLEKA